MTTPNHIGDELSHNQITPEETEAAQLTAYALGQLQGEELAEMERRLATGGDATMQPEIRETQSVSAAVSSAGASDALPKPTAALRDRIKKALNAESRNIQVVKPISMRAVIWFCAGTAACFALVSLMLPAVQSNREAARRMQASNRLKQQELEIQNYYDTYGALPEGADRAKWSEAIARAEAVKAESAEVVGPQRRMDKNEGLAAGYADPARPGGLSGATNHMSNQVASELPFLETRIGGRGDGTVAGPGGVPGGGLTPGQPLATNDRFAPMPGEIYEIETGQSLGVPTITYRRRGEGPGTEQYDRITENAFFSPLQQPLSTFSIDVDTASYANMRRFLTSGRLPPRNSVRVEELVNYFRYEYPQPKGNEPFSVNMEVAECPWAPGALTAALSQGERETKRGHLLLRVGLKGKEVHRSERPASNLVFLLDVSGSMADENKLPLLKTAMKMLVGQLSENDRVSIVTYAGDAGLKLKSTRGNQQQRITRAIDSLSAGGSTNGSAGIELAYEQATANSIQGGTNRVILCTDGDLNVGITSDEALTKLIKQKAKSGVFLTVLGFGEGNLKDAKMEKLADNGNGLYAYIDSVREARKVLVEQLTGSTITIAKDVKIQIEFNPAQIAAYRLLGYENRVLAAEDFNNDKKDAGEIGAGHTVTALYELVPAGEVVEANPRQREVDPLRYQKSEFRIQNSETTAQSGELLTLKLRYKDPEGETSKLLEYPLKDRGHSFHSASPDLQFAAAVASFGMILRNSQHRGSATLEGVAEIASAALGKDEGGYRAEFVDLVHKAKALGAR